MSEPIQWQPISMLPLAAQMIDEAHQSTQKQRLNLEHAKHNPFLLDGHELARMERAYTNQLETLNLFQQQCERWLADNTHPDTETQLLETMERLFEMDKMTRDVLEKLKYFIGI
ncbi:hypothetical protein [Rheinheimera sp.]|uniref:hypothetical protein n=1 Tax=Rheinheimera sp. TaxID=1869214 RepID=UPI004047E125